MIDAAYCQTLSRYNTWMNERLYALCADLPDAERRRDRGAFFRSIHSTLNHILYADLAFLSRFTGDPAEVPPLGVDLYDDFDALRSVRVGIDARLEQWSGSVTQDWLAAPFTFTSRADGKQRTLATWILVTQVFQHQVHHRGQLTTLLSQLGLDPGVTDLPFMPGVAVVES